MVKPKKKTAVIVILAALLIMAALFFLFRLLFRNDPSETIVLPAATTTGDGTDPSEPADQTGSSFLQVTPENVAALLQTLTVPEAYYQKMQVTVYGGTESEVQTVELWKRDTFQKAVITDEATGEIRNILDLGDGIYIWYEGDSEAVYAGCQESATFADLCGIPSEDEITSLDPSQILEAEYVTLDTDGAESCLYVRLNGPADGYETGYWIDLDTGFPIRATYFYEDEPYYSLILEDNRVLAPADEDYETPFSLPDGT